MLKEEGYIKDFRVESRASASTRSSIELKYGRNRERVSPTSSGSRSRAAASTRARTACRACSAASAPRSCPRRPAWSPAARPQSGHRRRSIAFVW